MRWLNVILTIIILVLPLWADPQMRDKFPLNPAHSQIELALSQTLPPTDSTTTPVVLASTKPQLKPGKALILSMIIPGAGQFYAKNPIMGGLFLAIEVGAFAGVAIYHSDGMSIEDEYKAYADDHWTYWDGGYNQGTPDLGSYLDFEYWCATVFGPDGQLNQTTDPDLYDGGIDEWQTESWNEKLDYLPQNGFTHELDPSDIDQQYYEMIGKYNQFGAGWPVDGDDDNGAFRDSAGTGTSQSWEWNVGNSYRENYLNQRKKSNDALDMSKNFTMVVLANHLVSALHAGLAVTWHNRKLNKEQKIEGTLHFDQKNINRERVNMASLRIKF